MSIISSSPNRKNSPSVITFGENSSVQHWGIVRMAGADFFPSSFQIKHKDVVIYIDPVGIKDGEKADFILLTHTHPDHFSTKDIKALLKPETMFVCAKKVTPKLGKFDRPIHEVKPGNRLEFSEFTCEAVAAYNTKPAFLGFIYMHPKSAENVGFVLTLSDGLRIYHAGDTHHIPEMDEISEIDLALLPVGGQNFVMEAEEAALFCNQLKPKLAVPIHFQMKNEQVATTFVEKLSEDIPSKFMH
ncbi:MAG: MBL fold metallo-hydrolase [Bacteroidia bacterium]|nr:MBL fold metallo-hydrolase [Bacteroidia bacterium]